MQITHWGANAQNRPQYVWRKTRIIRLRGYRHNRVVLKSLIDTMINAPNHLFLYGSENLDDLDVHADNVIPMLHVSSHREYADKIKSYLDLELDIVALSAFAATPIYVWRNTQLLMISGNYIENIKRSIVHAHKNDVPVYTEYFRGLKTSIPDSINLKNLPLSITDKLVICNWS